MKTAIQQIHTDTLATMPEDDLNRVMRRAQESLGKLRREGGSKGMIRLAEEEMCYVQRESEVRDRRRAAHARWLMARRQPMARG
jgi:methyl coenzyme M reductase subunit C-like uncharacterized protein (methanogenesis marker protein 7)